MIVLLVWLAIALYGVMVGPNHNPRYWHAVFAPGIWLVAQGVRFALDVYGSGDRRARCTAIIGGGALVVMLFGPLPFNIRDDAIRAVHYVLRDNERARLQAVGRRIAELSAPDDEIYVWGYSAGVYRFSGRRAACRFAGLDKLNNNGPRAHRIAAEIVATLRARRPAVIAVGERLYDDLLDNRACAVSVDGLAEWFTGNYVLDGAVPDFLLFVLRDTEAPGRQPDSPP